MKNFSDIFKKLVLMKKKIENYLKRDNTEFCPKYQVGDVVWSKMPFPKYHRMLLEFIKV